MDAEEFTLIIKISIDGKSYSVPDVGCNQGPPWLLRSKSKNVKQKEKVDMEKGNRPVSWYKIAEMMNSVHSLYCRADVNCDKPHAEMNKEAKQGFR